MWCRRKPWLCGALIVVGVLAVVAQEPMENLRIPLSHYPGGELKTELMAERAEVPPDGRIAAYGLILRAFLEDGSLEMEIKAEDCVCDRLGQVASSTNAVSLVRGPVTVTGEGFSWSGGDEKITITRNARVEFPSAIVQEERVQDRVQR
jgi:hypothetical protein